MRQTGDSLVAAPDEEMRLCLNNMHVLVPRDEDTNVRFTLGVLNSELLNWYYHSLNPEVGEALAEVKRTNVAVLPIKSIDPTSKRETKIATEIMSFVEAMVTACTGQTTLLRTLRHQILHTQHRAPTSLGHYLQNEYADTVTAEILIDDVMRKGFLHKVDIEADEESIVVSAHVSATAKEEPEIVRILRMRFAYAPLRQFVYACGRLFLALNARRKRWTSGRQPEEIYRRIMNTEEPLVFFHANAIDNLRAITGLMGAVAVEPGVSDLAAPNTKSNRQTRRSTIWCTNFTVLLRGN